VTTDSARPPAATAGPDAAKATPTSRTQADEQVPGSRQITDEDTRNDAGQPGGTRPATVRPDAARVDATGADSADGASLIAHERGDDYRARWAAVQGDFIDEPRKAVTDADTLVGEVLDQLGETFRTQRAALEQQWADDESTTEDLRIALRRYRTFFDRLLSL